MDRHEIEALNARLRRMEHRQCAQSVAWGLSIIIVLLFGLMVRQTASQPQVVRTQGVEIVDGTGRVLMTLDAVNRKPSLWLYDAAGRRRGGLTISAYGTPEFALNDEQGKTRISLRVGFDRAADLRLFDTLGRPRIGMWIGYDDNPGLWFFDHLARARIGLKVFSDGAPGLWLFENPSGRILFSAP